jgi:flagellar motor switch protein FliM
VEKLLSKDEIAELLSAIQGGEVDLDPAPSTGGAAGASGRRPAAGTAGSAQACNLIGAEGPEGWKLANFDLILDSFARNFAISLSNRFQRSANVKLDALESSSFELLLQKLSGRGSIGILQVEPLNGGALIIVDEQLSFSLVEIVLGGSSITEVIIPERSMSAIELNVVSEILESACPELDKGFQQMEATNSSLVDIVGNLRLLNFVALDAGVVTAQFRVTIDNLEGNISLVLPHSALEPLQKKQQQKAIPVSALQNSKWQKTVCAELGHMDVELEAMLASVSLRVRDILNFKVGDVIDLNCNPDAPLQVKVEGRAKFYGMAGVQGRKKAIRIMGRIPNGG